MKVLLDTCVWGGAKAHLQAAGHDVIWTGDLPEGPGQRGHPGPGPPGWSCPFFTLDKDFGELAIRRSLPHCGLVRLVNIAARLQGSVADHVLLKYGDELTRGAIITVEAGRVHTSARRRITIAGMSPTTPPNNEQKLLQNARREGHVIMVAWAMAGLAWSVGGSYMLGYDSARPRHAHPRHARLGLLLHLPSLGLLRDSHRLVLLLLHGGRRSRSGSAFICGSILVGLLCLCASVVNSGMPEKPASAHADRRHL